MRDLLLICVFTVCLISSQQVTADEAEKKEKIVELIQLSGALKQLDLNIRTLIPTVMSQIKANTEKLSLEDETELNNMVASELMASKDLYLSGLTPLYEKIFTLEEIQYSIDSYKSPISQSIAKKMPALIHHSQRMGQEWAVIVGQKATNKVVARAKELGYAFKEDSPSDIK
ncbi:MAG: DUF2059 domain-containing protein [Methylocystaceae bacterium]|nr:DUF2059 domain-containing protein [Methylocystaceae bacterium]